MWHVETTATFWGHVSEDVCCFGQGAVQLLLQSHVTFQLGIAAGVAREHLCSFTMGLMIAVTSLANDLFKSCAASW